MGCGAGSCHACGCRLLAVCTAPSPRPQYKSLQRSGLLPRRRERALRVAGLLPPTAAPTLASERRPEAGRLGEGSGEGSEGGSEVAAERGDGGGWRGGAGALDDFILAAELISRQWSDDTVRWRGGRGLAQGAAVVWQGLVGLVCIGSLAAPPPSDARPRPTLVGGPPCAPAPPPSLQPKDILEDSFGVLLKRGEQPVAAATINLFAPDHARIQVRGAGVGSSFAAKAQAPSMTMQHMGQQGHAPCAPDSCSWQKSTLHLPGCYSHFPATNPPMRVRPSSRRPASGGGAMQPRC
jgi:hypothetical protein